MRITRSQHYDGKPFIEVLNEGEDSGFVDETMKETVNDAI